MTVLSWDDFHTPASASEETLPTMAVVELPVPTIDIIAAKRMVLCTEEILQLSPT